MTSPASLSAMALMVRSRRLRSSSRVTAGENCVVEAAVAGRDLALEARERVLLVRLRMQEHREFAADALVALAHELLGSCADHHPVALADRQAEQPVPNRAANQVDLHGAHVNRESAAGAAGRAVPCRAGSGCVP